MLMSASELLVSSFLPIMHIYISHIRIGRTSRLNSLYFVCTHAFTITCNSRKFLPSSPNIGKRLAGSMATISHALFPAPLQWQFLSSEPVPLLSSYLLSELSDESDNNDFPFCLNKASSLLYLALYIMVSSSLSYRSSSQPSYSSSPWDSPSVEAIGVPTSSYSCSSSLSSLLKGGLRICSLHSKRAFFRFLISIFSSSSLSSLPLETILGTDHGKYLDVAAAAADLVPFYC